MDAMAAPYPLQPTKPHRTTPRDIATGEHEDARVSSRREVGLQAVSTGRTRQATAYADAQVERSR